LIPKPPWPNGLLLVLPLLLFNAALAGRLPPTLFGDVGVPGGLRALEHALRAAVFVGPLWLPTRGGSRAAWWLFGVGAGVYLASWAPALVAGDGPLTRNLAVYLAPYVTPASWLLGIAWIGRSRGYGLAALALVATHAAHGWFAWSAGS